MHDLFLSYSRADADAVREVRAQLEARGVRTFIDWHDLDPGQSWPDALERALTSSKAVAIVVGKSGFGVWQKRELYYALDLQVRSPHGTFPVVPLLLRGAEPPAGFLALNTWIDLRAGISEATLEPVIRMLAGVPDAAPAVDICPYRDLRSFREEDAALFFGRDEAIDAIVAKADRGSFVAIVGPSGSGKSSVAIAGVVPRLRRRRPPDKVWDAVIFTPGTHPWRSLADALVPLLEPKLSSVERIHKGGILNEALQQENGIASTVTHALAETRGTDRLLVVIDQFEELFTLADANAARGFLRALLDATRRMPMTVLVTLRSDYYGMAIALDRDLSNALPESQVNLGPMRPDELREIVARPASIAGLSFEGGLIDRILDDVGQEPGNLPLLEYALSELWELRVNRALTFEAYQEIGGVSGALAKRANALYDPLGASEKSAARRLMSRLVRVSAADEEGADTRRRARREEINDEAWKLVDSFVKARLLVVGENDLVEVAHEALIRKWDRLREWLNEDRKFLLWRQQLAIYRDAWPEILPPGPILEEAQKWWRERRAELSPPEREYVERSARKMIRSRWSVRVAAAIVAMALLFWGGWLIRTRTTAYNIDLILDKQPDERLFSNEFYGPDYDNDVANLALLIRLGREQQVLKFIDVGHTIERSEMFTKLAVAMQSNSKPRARQLLERALNEAIGGEPRVRVGRALRAFGERDLAIAVLGEAEEKLGESEWLGPRERLAEAWLLAHEPGRARQTLLRATGDQTIDPDLVDALIRVKDPADDKRIANAVGAILPSLKMPSAEREVRFQFIVQAFIDVKDLDKAKRLLAASPTSFTRDEILKKIAIAETRLHGHIPDAYILKQIEDDLVESSLIDEVLSELVRTERDLDAFTAEALITIASKSDKARAAYIKHLVNAGRFKEAIRQVDEVSPSDLDAFYLSHARRAYCFVRLGKRKEAEMEIEAAFSFSQDLAESTRDEVRSILAPSLAVLDRYRDARLMADSIENNEYQLEAYFAILRVYADRAAATQR